MCLHLGSPTRACQTRHRRAPAHVPPCFAARGSASNVCARLALARCAPASPAAPARAPHTRPALLASKPRRFGAAGSGAAPGPQPRGQRWRPRRAAPLPALRGPTSVTAARGLRASGAAPPPPPGHAPHAPPHGPLAPPATRRPTQMAGPPGSAGRARPRRHPPVGPGMGHAPCRARPARVPAAVLGRRQGYGAPLASRSPHLRLGSARARRGGAESAELRPAAAARRAGGGTGADRTPV